MGAPPATPADAQASCPADDPEASTGLDAYLERVAPETVAVTYWVDLPADTAPADHLVLRLAGRLSEPSPEGAIGADRFEHDEIVEGLVAGSGPVAVTTKVTGVAAGEWQVDAEAFLNRGSDTGRPRRVDCRRVEWSWLRWSAKPIAESPVTTRMLPL
ncbi:MAG: hypothetical protein KGQ66_17710, partial [Acidobacteriota bacterium]|nr:hypothetical protein [Acidobacteriota bacterium]